jgi:Bacterial type II and III secretion system protein
MKIQSLLVTSLLIASLHAQENQADPYRTPAPASGSAQTPDQPPNMSVCYEAFSLPLTMAATLQREQLADSALYAKLLAALGKESVKQETLLILRAKSGQKATTENISEQIYPTDFEPAQTPNSVSGSVTSNETAGSKPESATQLKPVDGIRTPATPKAFETRNAGTTLEVEPTCSEDFSNVDLRLVPEHVTMVGRSDWGQEFSTTQMPEFESQRINTAASVKMGQPFLLGTINRPPASKADPDSANRVWFAFVTVTLAKP